jgi:hypothetical protein
LRPWLLFLPPFISYESIIHENKQKSAGLCPSSPSGDHPSFQRLHGVGDRELDVPSHVLGLWPALETWVTYKGRNPLCWLSLEKSHENKCKSSFQFANILIFKFKRFHYFLYRQCSGGKCVLWLGLKRSLSSCIQKGVILWRIPAAMTWFLTNAKGSEDYILPDNPNILLGEWKGRELRRQ